MKSSRMLQKNQDATIASIQPELASTIQPPAPLCSLPTPR